jgi:hypothetical protein
MAEGANPPSPSTPPPSKRQKTHEKTHEKTHQKTNQKTHQKIHNKIHLNATKRFSVLDLKEGKPYIPRSSYHEDDDNERQDDNERHTWTSTYKFTDIPLPSHLPNINKKVDKLLVDINEPYTRELILGVLELKGGYDVKVGAGEGDKEAKGEEGWFQFSEYER